MYTVATVGLLSQDDYTVNIANEIPKLHERYDIILHAAGKAHSVPRSEAEKQMFFDVNLQGTKNLCAALEKVGVPRVFIFISTVAVYGCAYGENITEDHPLNGDTPYAMSKRLAEEYLQKWCYEHNVILGIIRPSLIAGPNPPGNLGAMIYGIRSGKYLSIAGSQARKSVLMVQDIAKLVPLLAEKGGIYNVCDSHHPTFRELETTICRQLDKKLPLSIPYWVDEYGKRHTPSKSTGLTVKGNKKRAEKMLSEARAAKEAELEARAIERSTGKAPIGTILFTAFLLDWLEMMN